MVNDTRTIKIIRVDQSASIRDIARPIYLHYFRVTYCVPSLIPFIQHTGNTYAHFFLRLFALGAISLMFVTKVYYGIEYFFELGGMSSAGFSWFWFVAFFFAMTYFRKTGTQYFFRRR